ncbi:MAG: hypothetical protein AAF528_13580 [Cyanobacteria bacterium P01_C01_bin.121]
MTGPETGGAEKGRIDVRYDYSVISGPLISGPLIPGREAARANSFNRG